MHGLVPWLHQIAPKVTPVSKINKILSEIKYQTIIAFVIGYYNFLLQSPVHPLQNVDLTVPRRNATGGSTNDSINVNQQAT